MKFVISQLVVTTIILCVGCATMQSKMQNQWKTVESADSISAYEDFLRSYPTGDLADQARARLQQLYKQTEWHMMMSEPISLSKKLLGKVDLPYFRSYFCEFSSEGNRFAYITLVSGKEHIIVDGVQIAGHDEIIAYGKAWADETGVALSPDGSRIAYTARDGDKWCVVVDDQEGERFDLVRRVVFSPDNKKVAYVAERDNRQFVVIDGLKQKQYLYIAEGPIFSSDSKHFAYIAKVTGTYNSFSIYDYYTVVIDGIEGEQYKNVRNLVFSPDGKRVAYRTLKSVVVDGIKSMEYYHQNAIDGPIFSPDGTHVAYVMARFGIDTICGEYVVVDSARGKEYHRVILKPGFSTDSKHIIYGAYKESSPFPAMVVIDSIEHECFDRVDMNTLYISDGRMAYCAEESGYSYSRKEVGSGVLYDAEHYNLQGLPYDVFANPGNYKFYVVTPTPYSRNFWEFEIIRDNFSISSGLHPRLQELLSRPGVFTAPQYYEFYAKSKGLTVDGIEVFDEIIGPMVVEEPNRFRFNARIEEFIYSVEVMIEQTVDPR